MKTITRKIYGSVYKRVCYQDKDIVIYRDVIAKAKELWAEICERNFAEFGDEGSCVIGAGIVVDYCGPRCRTAKDYMIIRAGEVSRAQGSLNWEHGKNEVLAFLKQNGVDARYDCGRMD